MNIEIESFLFKKDGQHNLRTLQLSFEKIMIIIEPYENKGKVKCFVFNKSKITSIYTFDDDPEEFEMPWDIIGISYKQRENNKYFFSINFGGIVYEFISNWPVEKIITQPKLSKN